MISVFRQLGFYIGFIGLLLSAIHKPLNAQSFYNQNEKKHIPVVPAAVAVLPSVYVLASNTTWDNKAHFIASNLIYHVSYRYTQKWYWAALITAGAGLTKEFVVDKGLGWGYFEEDDLLYDAFGVMNGLAFTLSMDLHEKRNNKQRRRIR
jgi:hypothetical protein